MLRQLEPLLRQLDSLLTQVDQLAIATLMVVVVVGSMRVLYGAWPWEARKTWYRTQPSVEYVARLRSASPESMMQRLASADTSTDCFDRSRMAQDNSESSEVTISPDTPPIAPKSSEVTISSDAPPIASESSEVTTSSDAPPIAEQLQKPPQKEQKKHPRARLNKLRNGVPNAPTA